ncbi:hypothetical protein [Flagellimonas sp.]|uniref:hypothetical protein n=1 Tax=Flagellimonas sp. TaxID=2058762 RepID=UPI003BB06700
MGFFCAVRSRRNGREACPEQCRREPGLPPEWQSPPLGWAFFVRSDQGGTDEKPVLSNAEGNPVFHPNGKALR